MLGLWLLVYFVSTFLLNAKRNELEKNNNRLQKLFDKIGVLTEQLEAAIYCPIIPEKIRNMYWNWKRATAMWQRKWLR